MNRPLGISVRALLFVAAVAGMSTTDVRAATSGTQWSPYLEWSLNNSTYSGNPFDLIATVTFTHTASGETHTTEMFYDGSDTWKFRFTATRAGAWTYATSSSALDLDGSSGAIDINANSDPDAHGFMKPFGDKWGWQGTERAFVPQLAMWGGNGDSSPKNFYNNPTLIDGEVQEYMDGHGFTGFHIAVVGGRWFDLNRTGNNVDTSLKDPDPRTFEALELLITKTHAAGGVVHIWAWGDDQRAQTPKRLSGGMNGTEDRRLQRYIAARLGPVPGWSIGYGFDLDEWVTQSQLKTWHDYMQSKLGWFHFLGGRPAGPNSGTNHSAYVGWNTPQDYSSYEHHRPTYDVYVAALQAVPGKPVFSEDRFRMRNEGRSKDYNEVDTRRGLWHSTMAGGVANIWGNLLSGSSAPYPNKDEIKTNALFFRTRFIKDMTRANGLTDGVCLKRPANRHYIFYKESTSFIQMDLSGMSGSQAAIAVDTKKAYAEINIGALSAANQTWNAPYSSDWAIAVGDFGASGPPANQAPTITGANASPSSGEAPLPVAFSASATDPEGDALSYRWDVDNDGSFDLTGATASYTYVSAGSYTVLLSVSDGTNVVTSQLTVTVNPAGGLVSNTSPASYVWGILDVGEDVYIDRAFTFSAVPAAYVGLNYLQTANNDKASTGSAFVTFDVSQDTTVYVAHDDRINPRPAWLSGFVDTGDNLVTTDTTLSLFAKDFPAGTVVLGGNEGGSASMYSVVVEPLGSTGGGADADPPSLAVNGLAISGRVDDPQVTDVRVGSQTVPLVSGSFSATVPVSGATAFQVRASDPAGNAAIRDITVSP